MAVFSRRHLLSLLIGGGMMAVAGTLPIAQKAHAYEDAFLLECSTPTPSTTKLHYPGASKIILSNNLVRPTGKSENALGQIVYLSGRVVDENCVPVEGAIVDLWQTDPFGQYRWASRNELMNPDAVFAGNGRAVTDNLGRYHFTTLFPGAVGKNAPKLHLHVRHPDLNDIYTTAFFRGDQRNNNDSQFRGVNSQSQALLLADVTYRNAANPSDGIDATFNITLRGKNTFRRY